MTKANHRRNKQAAGPQAILVECPKCKQPGFLDAWPRIVSTRDTDAMQKVLNGELFRYTCPICGTRARMVYECLVHDVEHRVYMLFTTRQNPDGKSIELLERLRELTPDIIPYPSSGDGKPDIYDSYQMRLVTSAHELCEKARIWADGYDDRAIELMKVAVKRGMLEEGLIGPRDTMIYERTMDNGGVSFVVTGEIPGDVVGVPQGYEFCKNFLAEKEAEGALEGIYQFNHAWANKFLP